MAESIAAWRTISGIEMPDALLGLLMSGWARIHGAVLLELFGHLEPLVGGGGAFYRYELDAFAQRLELGARPDPAPCTSGLITAKTTEVKDHTRSMTARQLPKLQLFRRALLLLSLLLFPITLYYFSPVLIMRPRLRA